MWCLLRFSHKHDVRFIFTSSCLLEGSCLINVIVFVCKYWCPTHIVLHFCFVCFLLVLCVCYVSSFSGLSIFDCHFGICRGCCNPVFTSIFRFICMFCRSLFVFLYFFFWPLCCLLFFDILILITPLVSSNSSYSFWLPLFVFKDDNRSFLVGFVLLDL